MLIFLLVFVAQRNGVILVILARLRHLCNANTYSSRSSGHLEPTSYTPLIPSAQPAITAHPPLGATQRSRNKNIVISSGLQDLALQ